MSSRYRGSQPGCEVAIGKDIGIRLRDGMPSHLLRPVIPADWTQLI